MRLRRGFSLVELTLVVVILALMAAMAIPRFASASARRNLDVASQRLVADLRSAQQFALARSQATQVRFNPSAHSYQVGAPSPTGNALGYVVTLAAPPMHCRIVSCTFTSNQIAFNVHGLPENTGQIVLAAGKYHRAITVTAGAFAPTVGPIEVPIDAGASIVASDDGDDGEDGG